ncbi:hypothetical protein [Furfurilactobacillus entadae]|uniref:hypothetical protein n=1 Tax=Furfurilactobacillus entadae TaxID=2922307 RepID=UPI0035EC20F2
MQIVIALIMIMIIAGLVLWRGPNFWAGALLALTLVLLITGLLWWGLVYLLNLVAARSMVIGLSILVILALVLVMLFFSTIIYLIHNTSVMDSREGRTINDVKN